MAQFYGTESTYLLDRYRHIVFWTIAIIIITLVTIFGITTVNLFLRGKYLLTFSLMFASFCILFVYKKFLNSRELLVTKFSNGINGEKVVSDLLKQLPEPYTVIQDLKVPHYKGNIDFVVVGPTGIFTIEVKSHSGLISFNGNMLFKNGMPFKEKDIFKQALHQATSLHEYIFAKTKSYVFIQPVIAFSSPSAFMRFGLRPVGRKVMVINKKWLLTLLTTQSSQPLLQYADITKEILKLAGKSTQSVEISYTE